MRKRKRKKKNGTGRGLDWPAPLPKTGKLPKVSAVGDNTHIQCESLVNVNMCVYGRGASLPTDIAENYPTRVPGVFQQRKAVSPTRFGMAYQEVGPYPSSTGMPP